MTISERALGIRELPEREQPVSEQFRIVAVAYADAEAAASLMEELKSTTLETMKSKLIAEQGEMPDNKAERLVKASDGWREYVEQMCAHRAKATKLRLKLEYVRMRASEAQSREANARHEARLGGRHA